MREHTLVVSKTARFFSLGELTPTTSEVWIVLHGYAQLAADFLQPFSAITTNQRYIVAPEGLNKFYAKGFGGKPAASWMTSEMREQEIRDYVCYLDELYLALAIPSSVQKVVLLGFSQGVATATRWLHHTTHRVDELVLYAGEMAAELRHPVSSKLTSLPITYITGNNDRLISADKLQEVRMLMQSIHAREIIFSGGHEVLPDVLVNLVSVL